MVNYMETKILAQHWKFSRNVSRYIAVRKLLSCASGKWLSAHSELSIVCLSQNYLDFPNTEYLSY